MEPSKLRTRQIARRLGVSERVLEQYLQLKRAEVLPSKADDGERSGTAPGEPTARGTTDRGAFGPDRRSPSRWTRRVQPVSAGRTRDPRRD